MWLLLLILLNVTWHTVSDARHTKLLHKDDQIIGYAKVGDLLTKREESEVQTSDASSSHSNGQEEKIYTETSNGNQGVSHLDDKKQQTQTTNIEGQRETTSSTIKPDHEVNPLATGPQQKQSENAKESLGEEAGMEVLNSNQLKSPTSQKGGQLDDKTHSSTQGNVPSTSIGTQAATNQSPAQEQTNLKDDKAGQAQQVSDSSKTRPSSHETKPQENPKGDKGNPESDQGQDAPEEGQPVPAVDLSKGHPTGVGYDTSTNEVFPNPAEENAVTQTPVPEFPNESEPSGPYDPSEGIPGISEMSPDEGMGTEYDDMSLSYIGKSSSKKAMKKEDEKKKSGNDM